MTKQILIGSTAIKIWIPTFRTPKDIDVLATEKIEWRLKF